MAFCWCCPKTGRSRKVTGRTSRFAQFHFHPAIGIPFAGICTNAYACLSPRGSKRVEMLLSSLFVPICTRSTVGDLKKALNESDCPFARVPTSLLFFFEKQACISKHSGHAWVNARHFWMWIHTQEMSTRNVRKCQRGGYHALSGAT